MNWMVAGAPPTVTFAACAGMGKSEIAVASAGAEPVKTGGVSAPAPVMNSVTICPRRALVFGTGALAALVKMPGAADASTNDWDATCPLLLIAAVAGPAAVS